MRGKRIGAMSATVTNRITPADAGKTRKRKKLCSWTEDHPRGCGENGKMTHVGWICGGSPPRMRGKQRRSGDDVAGVGLTPAAAGKTTQYCYLKYYY